jgi:alkylation response protein AidB-like acyl-CoA dehydrogenase
MAKMAGAIGYLVGAENQGLDIMFGMMNHARLAVGLQGLSISDRAYQQARAYAFDRVQGTPLEQKPGAPIVHHPDVLRSPRHNESRNRSHACIDDAGGRQHGSGA